jgi:hypothetical protein
VTAEDTAGNHFAGAVDVADLTPDAAPKVIPRLPR